MKYVLLALVLLFVSSCSKEPTPVDANDMVWHMPESADIVLDDDTDIELSWSAEETMLAESEVVWEDSVSECVLLVFSAETVEEFLEEVIYGASCEKRIDMRIRIGDRQEDFTFEEFLQRMGFGE